ncbi:MAG TPA: helix-turn-helix transcriptional regulator [Paludibacter sp.]
MKDRITQFLLSEGISPAEFADKIGVQRSSVSHVLNGRNYPSASFIQKILGSYNTLNPRWLLLGEGMMAEVKSKPVKESTLFKFPTDTEAPKTLQETVKAEEPPIKEVYNQISDALSDKNSTVVDSNRQVDLNSTQSMTDLVSASVDSKEVERIVIFFKDKTFTAYTPSK